jgi:hypothetical protein
MQTRKTELTPLKFACSFVYPRNLHDLIHCSEKIFSKTIDGSLKLQEFSSYEHAMRIIHK